MPVPPTHEIGGTGPSNFGREPLPEWQRRAALVAANRSSFCVSAAFVGQLSSTPSTTMPLPVPVDPGSDSAAKWVRWARPRRTMSLPRLPLSTVNTACVRRHGGRRHGRAQHPARSAIDPGPSVRIPARSQCRIGPIAVRSWTTTLRDQGSLTTVRPDVASIVPRSRHSYSQGPALVGDSIAAIGGGHGRRMQHRCNSRGVRPCVALGRRLCQSFLHAWLPP